jgi:hypothetical protein
VVGISVNIDLQGITSVNVSTQVTAESVVHP